MSTNKAFWGSLVLCLLQLITVVEPSLYCAAGHFTGSCSHASTVLPSYRHLNAELQRQQLHDTHKLPETLVELFKFMYPCASNAEAVLYVFYDPSQHLTAPSDWINHWNNVLGQHFAEANDTMVRLFSDVLSQASIDCLDSLLTHYVETGGRILFNSLHFDFSLPPPVVTTPEPPTTPPPPTTTPTTTTPSPVTCVVCSGLECLLHRHSQTCSSHERYCYVMVVDQGEGRKITRGCADSTFCSQTNPAQCATVESLISTADTSCVFCCQSNDCNLPPALIPV